MLQDTCKLRIVFMPAAKGAAMLCRRKTESQKTGQRRETKQTISNKWGAPDELLQAGGALLGGRGGRLHGALKVQVQLQRRVQRPLLCCRAE